MRFKYLTLIAFLFFYTSLCKAETSEVWSLNLQFENDEMLNLKINNQLTLIISDNKIVISQDSLQDGASYLISDIKGITYAFSKADASVSEILSSQTIKFHKNSIEISNPCHSGEVKIYSIDGSVVHSSSFSDSLQIDLSTYRKGVYVLSINNSSSIKFIIK